MNARIAMITGLVLVALTLVGCSETPSASAVDLAKDAQYTMLEKWANDEVREWEIRARTLEESEDVASKLLRWANNEALEWEIRDRHPAAGPHFDVETIMRWINAEAHEWQARSQ
jgi:hypothetical protein